jgi:hypothetical protein
MGSTVVSWVINYNQLEAHLGRGAKQASPFFSAAASQLKIRISVNYGQLVINYDQLSDPLRPRTAQALCKPPKLLLAFLG